MALSQLASLSIPSFRNFDVMAKNSMNELINFMNHHFLQCVILDLILTQKLTILGILLKFNLSTKGLNSLT